MSFWQESYHPTSEHVFGTEYVINQLQLVLTVVQRPHGSEYRQEMEFRGNGGALFLRVRSSPHSKSVCEVVDNNRKVLATIQKGKTDGRLKVKDARGGLRLFDCQTIVDRAGRVSEVVLKWKGQQQFVIRRDIADYSQDKINLQFHTATTPMGSARLQPARLGHIITLPFGVDAAMVALLTYIGAWAVCSKQMDKPNYDFGWNGSFDGLTCIAYEEGMTKEKLINLEKERSNANKFWQLNLQES